MQTMPLISRAALALMLTASTLTLGACATTTGGGGTDVYCRASEPIRWSRSDTDETIRQAKAHNAAGAKLCGWRA